MRQVRQGHAGGRLRYRCGKRRGKPARALRVRKPEPDARYGAHRADQGRLEKKTLALLKSAGYDISELEAGSRKLIFALPDTGVEIVLAKAADVITLCRARRLRYGRGRQGHDHGKGRQLYEMVDPGFGKCRFALATKKGKDVYGGYQTPVIATKYPAVTKAFLTARIWTWKPSRSRVG